jgi:hypothetical protein
MAAIAVDGQAVLTAFLEVENALANERIFTQRLVLLDKVVDDNQRAYELAVKQYEVGRIEVQNVLQIQPRSSGSGSPSATNCSATPLLHQRWPVGLGPSLKTWP